MNGKIDEFSIERVTEYMQKLGYDIHISTTPAPKGRNQEPSLWMKGVGEKTTKKLSHEIEELCLSRNLVITDISESRSEHCMKQMK